METLWFILIAGLFTGYFVLEGFDFGVGLLVRVLGRDERSRSVVVDTIGPVWDGNEVWLITAAGAMFAAFPLWYATLLPAVYLPLLAILLALIGRGVGLEFRGKRDEPWWRARWDAVVAAGSLAPAFLWGVVFANVARGMPLTADHEYAGGLLDLLSPYALLGGLAFLAVFVTHGAYFVALKTDGEVRVRANRLARRLGPVALLVLGGFLLWTGASALAAGAVLALAGSVAANRAGREGRAFTGTVLAIGLTVAAIFAGLYPAVLPSTMDPAGTLTVANAASAPYTLKIMTWVAVAFAPIVLLYQGWTYWVFRERLTSRNRGVAPPGPMCNS
jgi:cytochrome bd ubiquinol oxidase subunit II